MRKGFVQRCHLGDETLISEGKLLAQGSKLCTQIRYFVLLDAEVGAEAVIGVAEGAKLSMTGIAGCSQLRHLLGKVPASVAFAGKINVFLAGCSGELVKLALEGCNAGERVRGGAEEVRMKRRLYAETLHRCLYIVGAPHHKDCLTSLVSRSL